MRRNFISLLFTNTVTITIRKVIAIVSELVVTSALNAIWRIGIHDQLANRPLDVPNPRPNYVRWTTFAPLKL